MSTPILNPNSPSSTITNANSSSQIHIKLGNILRKHDSNAIRLYDFINHVKVFLYNSNTLCWENNPLIEGSLFAYERQQTINNQIYPSHAFAIINRERNLLQQITSDMSEQADKLRLFYEIRRNNKPEVFCLYFSNETECLRVHGFINQYIQSIRNVTAQQQVTISAPQSGSSRIDTNQTSTPPAQIETGNSSEDPTLSLKRLLNIRDQNGLDNEPIVAQQKNSVNLIPPSAFVPKTTVPSWC
jgi:hypothetical protein